jgi:release factor glutamine methyltransferase
MLALYERFLRMNKTLKQILDLSAKDLTKVSDSAMLDAQCLLAKVLSCSREWLYTHAEESLSIKQHASYESLLARRMQGEPLAYILGRKGFYDLELEVTPDVLIPRPDTECLVDFILAEHVNVPKRVLDLGTGSGAIALALGHARPTWSILAVDESDAALAVAQRNAKRYQCGNVAFQQSDWFAAIAPQAFDIIVSNPPYIAENDEHLSALRYEPVTALTAGSDGLDDIRSILKTARAYLAPEGMVVIEHGYDQAAGVAACANRLGYAKCVTHKDLSGNFRFISAIVE